MNKANDAQLRAGVVLSYVSMALGVLIQFFVTPFILEKLGQSEYGLYTIATSVTGYLSLFGFGFASTYVHFYSKYKESNDECALSALNGVFIKIFFVVSLLAFFVGLLISQNISSIFGNKLSMDELVSLKRLIILLSINLSLEFASSIFSAYITANEKFIFFKILSTVSLIAKPTITIWLICIGSLSESIAISSLTVTVMINAVYAIYCFKKLRMNVSFSSSPRAVLLAIIKYSGFIFVIMIVDQINWNIDKLLLGMLHGTVATAVYGLAAIINTQFTSLSTAVSSVYTPKVHLIQSGAEDESIKNERLTQLMTRVGRVQFFVLSLAYTGFIAFGKQFIQLWAGQEYAESYYVLLLLMGSGFIPLIQNVGIEIRRAKNKQMVPTIVSFVQAILNLLISIPLCIAFGPTGCALGTALAMTIGTVFKNLYYHVVLKIDMIFFWKRILRLSFPVLITALLGVIAANTISIEDYTDLFVTISCYICLYLLNVLVLGLNHNEQIVICKKLKHIVCRMR